MLWSPERERWQGRESEREREDGRGRKRENEQERANKRREKKLWVKPTCEVVYFLCRPYMFWHETYGHELRQVQHQTAEIRTTTASRIFKNGGKKKEKKNNYGIWCDAINTKIITIRNADIFNYKNLEDDVASRQSLSILKSLSFSWLHILRFANKIWSSDMCLAALEWSLRRYLVWLMLSIWLLTCFASNHFKLLRSWLIYLFIFCAHYSYLLYDFLSNVNLRRNSVHLVT